MEPLLVAIGDDRFTTGAGDDEDDATMTAVAPFASAVDRYTAAGWLGPVPLPARRKKSPPTGYTGADGAYATVTDIDEWRTHNGTGNIGLRMAPDVIGIDVDDYGDKTGGSTLADLEAELGHLPHTWVSTSRMDGVSGIRFFRLAEPVRLIGSLPGIEIIQRHHRYAVVAPSIHPDGREYLWLHGGEVVDVPNVADLPPLPAAWVEHLRSDRRTGAQRQAMATGSEVSPAVEKAFGRAAMGMTAGTRHDTTLRSLTTLLRFERQEHPGATRAIADLERLFVSAVTADGTRSDREAQGEWDRMVESAGDEVASTPSIIPKWEPTPEPPDADALGLTSITPDTVTGEPWPEPRHVEPHGALPPFPVASLPSWAQDHVVAAADAIQVPVDLTATLAIGALVAACTGRAKVHVTVEWYEPMALYLVCALPSGAGKSPAHAKVARWLDDWEAEQVAAVQDAHDRALLKVRHAKKQQAKLEGGMGADSDLFAALDAVAAAEAEVPPLPRVLIDDATPEAVATLLAAHDQRLAITSTEADLFDMLLRGKPGQRQNMNIYLKAWSADPFRRDRKGGSESGPESMVLRRPMLSCSVTVQPAVLARVAGDEEMASRGFAYRFMVSMPDNWLGSRDQRRRFRSSRLATTAPYESMCRSLAARWARWEHPADLRMSGESAQAVEDFLVELEPQLAPGEPLERLAEWVNKVYASVVRYAGLLHLAEEHATGDPVGVETTRRAIDLGRYWLAHAYAVVGMAGDKVVDQAQTILTWAASNGAQFTLADLHRQVRRPGEGLDKVADYVPALELLVDLGWVRPVDSGDWRANVGVRRAKSPNFALCPSVVGMSPTVAYPRTARTAYWESDFSLCTPSVSTPPLDPRGTRTARIDQGPVDNPAPDPAPTADWMEL